MNNIKSLLDEAAELMAGTSKSLNKTKEVLTKDLNELKQLSAYDAIRRKASEANIDLSGYRESTTYSNIPCLNYYAGDSLDTTITLYLDSIYNILVRVEDSNSPEHMGGWISREYYIEHEGWLDGSSIADISFLYRDTNKLLDGKNEWFKAEIDQSLTGAYEIEFTSIYVDQKLPDEYKVAVIELTRDEDVAVRNMSDKNLIDFITQYISTGFIKYRTLTTQ